MVSPADATARNARFSASTQPLVTRMLSGARAHPFSSARRAIARRSDSSPSGPA
jgi:hypothetical protein